MSRFGSAIQVLPSDIGLYLSSLFNVIVVVCFFFYFYFIIEKCFFYIYCKFFCQKESLHTLLFLLISIGSLFHNDGPLYDTLFKPLFDYPKGCFNLWKDARLFMLLGSAGKWISLKYSGLSLLKNLQILYKTHCENLSFIVKLGNRCALKLEKATKALFTGFFSCYLSPKLLHG